MDHLEVSDGGGIDGGGGGVERGSRALKIFFRCWFSVVLFAAASFLFSFVFGLLAMAFGSFSASRPVSVPAECKIISKSVDIRSSKVCELGVLNFKSKHVLYPSEKQRFRCYDDYYWASVFEVEYEEYLSGRMLHAVSEVPKRALPLDCRPTFGTIWLATTKFEVNESYHCTYILGSRKVDISSESMFNCQAKEPSRTEMLRRFFILFSTSMFSFDKEISGRGMGYMVAGAVSGMLVGMCSVIVFKSIRIFLLALARHYDTRKPQIRVFALRFRRACLLVAYLATMGWLTVQYGKMVGLKQLFYDSEFGERVV